jgi:hypothetical protein
MPWEGAVVSAVGAGKPMKTIWVEGSMEGVAVWDRRWIAAVLATRSVLGGDK